jgi:hypothetical protein
VPEHLIADIVSGKEPLDVAPYGGTLRLRGGSLGSPDERIERLRQLSERQRSVRVVRQDMEPPRNPSGAPSSW